MLVMRPARSIHLDNNARPHDYAGRAKSRYLQRSVNTNELNARTWRRVQRDVPSEDPTLMKFTRRLSVGSRNLREMCITGKVVAHVQVRLRRLDSVAK